MVQRAKSAVSKILCSDAQVESHIDPMWSPMSGEIDRERELIHRAKGEKCVCVT